MLEHYHTANTYRSGAMKPLVDHAQAYINGTRSIPVLKFPTHFGKSMTLTFTNSLIKDLANNPSKYQKPVEVALKFGFRGYSRGEKNGVFLQRKQDSSLHETTHNAMYRVRDEITEDLETPVSELDELRKIKVVSHGPDRLVGLYQTQNQRAILLDWATH